MKKNFKYVLILFLSLFTFFSCNNVLVDEKPESEKTNDTSSKLIVLHGTVSSDNSFFSANGSSSGARTAFPETVSTSGVTYKVSAQLKDSAAEPVTVIPEQDGNW